jgi:uncharacterized protein YbaA (DUF1428 family)
MIYIDGFVVPVPTASKDAYRKHAATAAPVFKELGATRMVECWGDDVPQGKITDFHGLVQLKPDETVVFSWVEYPSKAARESANARMREDRRMMEMAASAPFDAKRMVYGGFTELVDVGRAAKMSYADGFIVAVPTANIDRYRALAEKASVVFREFGATRVVESRADDVPDGEVTDFRRGTKAKDGEIVVFSFIEWPSKDARQQGWKKIMEDERMKHDPNDQTFDGKRLIYGGFAPIVDA